MFLLLKNDLHGAVRIVHRCKSQPLSACLFNILSDEMKSVHGVLLPHTDARRSTPGKSHVRSLEWRAELTAFLREHLCYSSGQPSNEG